MKVYEVPVRFTLEGKFFIKAVSQEESVDQVRKQCGLVILPGCLHTSLPKVDWDFPVHADQIILFE